MRKLIPLLIITTLLTACGTTGRYTGSAYNGREVRTAETVRTGKIISMSPIRIDGGNGNNGLAEIGGVVVGAVLGSMIGGGNGQILTTIAGGALGGAAAGSASRAANDLNGVRITVKLDNGQTLAFSQEMDADTQSMRIGDSVFIYSSGSTTRVSR